MLLLTVSLWKALQGLIYLTDSALVEANGRLLAVRAARRGRHRAVPAAAVLQRRLRAVSDDRRRAARSTPGGVPVGHDRVTDETCAGPAPRPAGPRLSRPNRIADADWAAGFRSAGSTSREAGTRRIGRCSRRTTRAKRRSRAAAARSREGSAAPGLYTGLSFFRQLPAGVPGAFRLFANLLALPR